MTEEEFLNGNSEAKHKWIEAYEFAKKIHDKYPEKMYEQYCCSAEYNVYQDYMNPDTFDIGGATTMVYDAANRSLPEFKRKFNLDIGLGQYVLCRSEIAEMERQYQIREIQQSSQRKREQQIKETERLNAITNQAYRDVGAIFQRQETVDRMIADYSRFCQMEQEIKANPKNN